MPQSDACTASTRALNLVTGAFHCMAPAAGPKKKPKYFAAGRTEKHPQSGMLRASQVLISETNGGEKGTRGTKLHLIGLRFKPARAEALSKTGFKSFRDLSVRSAAPRSSAHARRMPDRLRSTLVKWLSMGLIAMLNRKAEAGQPCRTPDRKKNKNIKLPLTNV